MSHYFESPQGPEKRHDITANIWQQEYIFTTANGVFSAARLDAGTAVLLKNSQPPSHGRVLDLGCGFGSIAVAIARSSPNVLVDAVDVNNRALELTKVNVARYHLSNRVKTLRPEEVENDIMYDHIWSNPPIRIGKEALHLLLLHWLSRLKPQGEARMVVSKNLGADSLQRWLQTQQINCSKIASAKGFRILKCTTNS